MDLSHHFLSTYSQVIETEVSVEGAPWHRMDHSGKEHVHAFIQRQEAKRFCVVRQEKNGTANRSPISISADCCVHRHLCIKIRDAHWLRHTWKIFRSTCALLQSISTLGKSSIKKFT